MKSQTPLSIVAYALTLEGEEEIEAFLNSLPYEQQFDLIFWATGIDLRLFGELGLRLLRTETEKTTWQ